MAGNGKNGKYTAQQFIDAIPGTGGIISAIASRVGCAWDTAKKYTVEYATVNRAWENERARIKDRARYNIVVAIEEGDLATSKWYLALTDDEFLPKQQTRVIGEIKINVTWPDGSPATAP